MSFNNHDADDPQGKRYGQNKPTVKTIKTERKLSDGVEPIPVEVERVKVKLKTNKTMKTLKGWEKSKVNLDIYLNEPCEIDEDLFNDILETVSPSYLNRIENDTIFVGQAGEACGSFQGDKKKRFTYMTVSTIGNKHFYLGVLPEFKS